MERKPYSAGAVKFSFWFMEFRKTVQLLSEGKSFADIKKLNEETNIYGAPTKLRAQQIYSTVSEPSAEMQIKIIRAKDAIASQKPRTVRCPYCRHNSIIVFEDTRGHVQTKCKACGRETVFNVLEMRRLRRLQLYYSSLNG